MTKKKAEVGRQRKGFSPEFRRQALLRAATEGVPAVAQDLGLQPAQLYGLKGDRSILPSPACLGRGSPLVCR
jgi:transposase-like protein